MSYYLANMANEVNGVSGTLEVDARIYPLQAIYGAAYTFLDRVYIFLDGDPDGIINVRLKTKEGIAEDAFQVIRGEFQNELLNYALRVRISESNKKIREYIVGTALLGTAGDVTIYPADNNFETKSCGCDENNDSEISDMDDFWKDDPLGIAIPWEDKYLNQEEKETAKNEAIVRKEKEGGSSPEV